MANKLSDLFVKLGLNSSSFNKGIDGAQKKTNSFAKGLKKIGGLIAGAFAIGAITNFAKESVRLFNVQAQAENTLLVALKGRQDVQQDLIRQARQLQGITLFGDEETIQAQSLIAAFVKEGEQIKKVIPLVQDLATAKGMQLAAAADLVSKTLGSSTNALSRYGIEVEGTVGSVERLESLMQGLNDAFGGQAEAAAKVGTGALIQFKNAFGDLKEVIGGLIIETQNLEGSFVNSLTKITNKTTGFFDKLSTFRKAGFGRGASLVATIFGSKEDFNIIQNALSSTTESAEKANKVTKDSIKTVGDLKIETDLLKSSLELLGVNQDAELQKTLKQIAANEKLIKQLTTLRSTRGATPAEIATRGETPQIGLAFVPEEGLAAMDSFFTRMSEQLDNFTADYLSDWKQLGDDLDNLIIDGILSVADEFGAAIESIFAGDFNIKDLGGRLLGTIGDFLGEFGKMLIAYGIAQEAFWTSLGLGPLGAGVAIAAGVALIAIGGAISGVGQKVSKGNLSTSGGVGGASGGGFNPGGGTRAEDNRVIFELEGTKLIGLMQNTNRRTGIIA